MLFKGERVAAGRFRTGNSSCECRTVLDFGQLFSAAIGITSGRVRQGSNYEIWLPLAQSGEFLITEAQFSNQQPTSA